MLVTRGLATYHELETVYSCEDALRMLEMLRISDYNAWLYQDEAERKMKAQNGIH